MRPTYLAVFASSYREAAASDFADIRNSVFIPRIGARDTSAWNNRRNP
jgi:hypothetical protein